MTPLCGVAETPDCGMLDILSTYKPFMWCRLDARLRHTLYCYPFEASLQTPDWCILFLLADCIFIYDMINLLACIMSFIYDWRSNHGIFQSMIISGYIIPVFLMFASTFKVLTGLSLAIVLAKFLACRGALRWQPRNLHNGDSSLAKIGVIQVSCSCEEWSSTDADDHKPLPPPTTRNLLLYS